MQNENSSWFSSSQVSIEDKKNPILAFQVEDFKVDRASFCSVLDTEVAELEWDYYDVRRYQRELLLMYVPQAEAELSLLNEFYAGHVSLNQLQHLLNKLPSEVKPSFENKRPNRRRCVSRFTLIPGLQPSDWCIERLKVEPIKQNVDVTDIRSIPRKFKEMSHVVTDHPEFQKLLFNVADLVKSIALHQFTGLEINCWHTSVTATATNSGSNAPEGIHQDGADYIISALVLERRNVCGGTSRIFGPDKCSEILSKTLQVGEGIFQADTGSDLWHDVTPITPLDSSLGIAERRTLGLDVVLLKS